MLAAAPAVEDRALNLFILALSMLKKDDPSLPSTLRAYAAQVIAQADELVTDPHSVKGPIMPEAMELALRMRHAEDMRKAITSAAHESSIPPSLADEILRRMETSSVRDG